MASADNGERSARTLDLPVSKLPSLAFTSAVALRDGTITVVGPDQVSSIQCNDSLQCTSGATGIASGFDHIHEVVAGGVAALIAIGCSSGQAAAVATTSLGYMYRSPAVGVTGAGVWKAGCAELDVPARTGFATCVLDAEATRVVVFGGFQPGVSKASSDAAGASALDITCLSDMWYLSFNGKVDAATAAWKQVSSDYESGRSPRPVARAFSAISPLPGDKNAILVHGGVTAQGEILSDVWIMRVSKRAWERVDVESSGVPLSPRCQHSLLSCPASGGVLVFGGSTRVVHPSWPAAAPVRTGTGKGKAVARPEAVQTMFLLTNSRARDGSGKKLIVSTRVSMDMGKVESRARALIARMKKEAQESAGSAHGEGKSKGKRKRGPALVLPSSAKLLELWQEIKPARIGQAACVIPSECLRLDYPPACGHPSSKLGWLLQDCVLALADCLPKAAPPCPLLPGLSHDEEAEDAIQDSMEVEGGALHASLASDSMEVEEGAGDACDAQPLVNTSSILEDLRSRTDVILLVGGASHTRPHPHSKGGAVTDGYAGLHLHTGMQLLLVSRPQGEGARVTLPRPPPAPHAIPLQVAPTHLPLLGGLIRGTARYSHGVGHRPAAALHRALPAIYDHVDEEEGMESARPVKRARGGAPAPASIAALGLKASQVLTIKVEMEDVGVALTAPPPPPAPAATPGSRVKRTYGRPPAGEMSTAGAGIGVSTTAGALPSRVSPVPPFCIPASADMKEEEEVTTGKTKGVPVTDSGTAHPQPAVKARARVNAKNLLRRSTSSAVKAQAGAVSRAHSAIDFDLPGSLNLAQDKRKSPAVLPLLVDKIPRASPMPVPRPVPAPVSRPRAEAERNWPVTRSRQGPPPTSASHDRSKAQGKARRGTARGRASGKLFLARELKPEPEQDEEGIAATQAVGSALRDSTPGRAGVPVGRSGRLWRVSAVPPTQPSNTLVDSQEGPRSGEGATHGQRRLKGRAVAVEDDPPESGLGWLQERLQAERDRASEAAAALAVSQAALRTLQDEVASERARAASLTAALAKAHVEAERSTSSSNAATSKQHQALARAREDEVAAATAREEAAELRDRVRQLQRDAGVNAARLEAARAEAEAAVEEARDARAALRAVKEKTVADERDLRARLAAAVREESKAVSQAREVGVKLAGKARKLNEVQQLLLAPTQYHAAGSTQRSSRSQAAAAASSQELM